MQYLTQTTTMFYLRATMRGITGRGWEKLIAINWLGKTVGNQLILIGHICNQLLQLIAIIGNYAASTIKHLIN